MKTNETSSETTEKRAYVFPFTHTRAHTYAHIYETDGAAREREREREKGRKSDDDKNEKGTREIRAKRKAENERFNQDWVARQKLAFAGRGEGVQARLNAWYYVGWWMPLVNFIISWVDALSAGRFRWKSRKDEIKNRERERRNCEIEEKDGGRKERKKKREKKRIKKRADRLGTIVAISYTVGRRREILRERRKRRRRKKLQKRGRGKNAEEERWKERERGKREVKKVRGWLATGTTELALGANIRPGGIYSYKLSGSFAEGRTQREICLH